MRTTSTATLRTAICSSLRRRLPNAAMPAPEPLAALAASIPPNPPQASVAAVDACRISAHLGGQPVLQDVSVSVGAGQWLALVGPNGAGKSTLLRVLAGLASHQGRVEVFGTAMSGFTLRQRATQVGYVPQRPVLPEAMLVADYVLLGRNPHFTVAGWARASDRTIVAQVLAELDLSTLASRRVGSLSGGQFARVELARALAQRPQVLLLDEPTAALDIGHAHQALELLDRQRAQYQLTVITALHELNLASAFATQIALLNHGKLIATGTPNQVFTNSRLTQVYRTPVCVQPHQGRLHISVQRS